MKKYITKFSTVLISILFTMNAIAQEATQLPSSKIFIVRTTSFVGSAVSSYILFQNQQPFNLPVGGVIEYTIFSEGEVSIRAEYTGQGAVYCNLTVKRGGEYYVYLNLQKFEEVSREAVAKILNSSTKKSQRQENIDTPINRASLADIYKKDGKGQGTCFLISQEGYFITNYHCIENAKEITIKGIDGDFTTKYGATLVASDPSNDLALIKISNKNVSFEMPPFVIKSTGVSQADKVYALGYPNASAMGEEVKITEGIISSKSGAHGDVSKFQISAAVNPGNSGGPLIDDEGCLIGVIYAKSTLAESAGYAIKSGYLDAFLKNIDGFTYPVSINLIKDKSLPEKVSILKKYIFIIETN